MYQENTTCTRIEQDPRKKLKPQWKSMALAYEELVIVR
jgi:hypothetical protein